MKIKDAAGNDFTVGAIVQMKHFVTKRKKYYMYKQVVEVNTEKQKIGFCHLPIKEGQTPRLCFSSSLEEVKNNCLIVECYYPDLRELKRNKYFR